jgi:hypothetical protein
MQDEHLMKLWSEARQDVFVSVEHRCECTGSIGQAYEDARASDHLLAACQRRLARLLSRAIPVGILAGTLAAALASAATAPLAPRTAGSSKPMITSFALPYVA